ncbi:MAG: patatin-like phospholipase family protein [Ottowia sp.]|nr:patatin-like phospholipase family protein [Ottowia sp.]
MTAQTTTRVSTGAVQQSDHEARHRVHLPAYETVALILQGGGTLGAYQAGIYEGLSEAGIAPNWIAGISIGALNAAIIAGNAPENRVQRLREFWNTLCEPAYTNPFLSFIEQTMFDTTDDIRKMLTHLNVAYTVQNGQKGFFTTRIPSPWITGSRDPKTVSYYDTAPLKTTLERLCDFDRINAQETRVSVGAVNINTGNFCYFDNTKMKLRAEHFMASGALPPGFAAIEIDGQFYWDGGLVSNTPLSEVLQTSPRRDTLAFQVDLWNALGEVPTHIDAVGARVKDIQYSSRTRFVTDSLNRSQHYRRLLHEVLKAVPTELKQTDRWCKLAEKVACGKRYNVVHLIYRNKAYETEYKDIQFSMPIMHAHWQSGLDDIRHTFKQDDWLDMPNNDSGFVTHDIHR